MPTPWSRCTWLLAAVGWTGGAVKAQDPSSDGSPGVIWQAGPTTAEIGDQAEIQIPPGYQFTGAAGTQAMLKVMQNIVSGNELGLLAPADDEHEWFLVFEYDDCGYVKDDEKNNLDAEAMMKAMRESNRAGNEERRKRGWSELRLVGWEQPPHYDTATNNLEWAIRLESEGHPGVNYNTRLLGRGGVMEVNLVVDPEDLQTTLPDFKKLLTGFSFKAGQRYAEFRKGDKLAKYGLAALVTGGAAAVALKTGLLQKLWKFIVVGIIAIGAAIKKIFGGGRKSAQDQWPQPR